MCGFSGPKYGERGHTLSGGERQRVAIARGLRGASTRRSPIVVAAEAAAIVGHSSRLWLHGVPWYCTNVKARKVDTITAPAIAIANSENKRPVTPVVVAIGRKMATD